jgi:zinc/manganese transport system substrate-binding protein
MTTVDECKLVTGHDSLGYFAARYGCTVVGAVIPGFSTAAEASAGSLADLKVVAQENGVKAIFTELGTPADVAAQIAKEVGVDVVELSTHVLPENGGYDDMMTQLATAIAGGLS